MDLYDFPQAFRGLTLNGHRTAAGALDPTKESDTIRVNVFDFSKLQQRDQREPLHLLTGGDLGDASLAFRYLSVAGTIRASSGAKLSDRIAELLRAFDVESAQLESPSTEGLLPFTFTDVTEVNNGRGTAFTDERGHTGYYVKERFLARPASFPIITQRRSGGDSAGFAAELVCADPRRYCDTAELVTLSAGGSGLTGTAPNWNSTQGKAVPVVYTITMSGAGSAGFAINAPDDLGNLVLNLSGLAAGNVVTVDTATGIIKVGATERNDLRTSAVGTLFHRINPAGGTVDAANVTGIGSITVAYRQARM